MSLLYFRNADETSDEPVSDLHPLPVEMIGNADTVGDVVTRTIVVPGVGTGAHSANDTVGQLFEISQLARESGKGGVIETVALVETTTNSISTELWLFDRVITPAADDAAHSISDAHAASCVGVVPITAYYASALNSVGVARGVGLAFQCRSDSSSLFGLLVTRGAPTYAASGITVAVSVIQE